MTLTPSRQLALTGLAVITGVIAGSYIEASTVILGWLTGLWLLVAVSGQTEPLETLSWSFFGLTLGAWLWQLTSGEAWLNLAVLHQLSDVLSDVRNSLVDKIALALNEPQGSLLSGILLGNRVKLDPDLIEVFRTVGLTHIIAVSGYNLTILTANILSLTWPLIGRRALWLAGAMIVLFVIITGAPSSVLRAAAMAITVLLARYLGRPSRSINILIFASALLVIFEPKIVFDVGFQLSVAATYGLIRLSPYLNQLLGRTRLWPSLRQILAETLAAIALTTPLIIGHFERLSLISPLANLLVLPIIPLTMAIGLIGLAVALVVPALGSLLLLASWPLLAWVVVVSEKLAAWQFSSTDLSLPALVIVGLMALIIGGLEWLNLRRPLQYDLLDRLAQESHAG